MLRKFGLESLNVIDDGSLGSVFNRLLGQAVDDCSDRPGVKTARKVSMTVSLMPVPDSDLAALQFDFKSSIPSKTSRGFTMKIIQSPTGPVLAWNEEEFDDFKPAPAPQEEE